MLIYFTIIGNIMLLTDSFMCIKSYLSFILIVLNYPPPPKKKKKKKKKKKTNKPRNMREQCPVQQKSLGPANLRKKRPLG